MEKVINVALLSLIGLYACSEQHPAETAKIKKAVFPTQRKVVAVPVDTSAAFRIGSYWVTPDSLFEFNALERVTEDTLYLATCQKNVIDPFGSIENKSQLKTSLLKSFSVKTKYAKQESGIFPVLLLSKGQNKLVLYFDQEPEASASSYILKGEINDSTVAFANNIRVGMPVNKFYQQFFTVFPLALQHQYKAVVFDYCVDGIRHLYEIDNGRIAAVKFSTPGSFWEIDY